MRGTFALAFAIAALGAGEPRAAPAFEPEAVVRRTDGLRMLALARAGERIVAAGERGRILLSDDLGMTWRVASTPTYQTLTSLYFVDARNGFATGHQGTLLRTLDAGRTWSQARVEGAQKSALFAVRMRGTRGIAVGSYGAYLESSDAGASWSARPIAAPDFDRHLTGIAAGNGSTVIAGEAGTLFASSDNGATWKPLPAPYAGSFFGAIGLPGGSIIVYGMRGNAFRSVDGARTWRRVDLGSYTGAIQGGSQLDDGTMALTGDDGMLATSTDGGETFTVRSVQGRFTMSALLAPGNGRSLSAGPSGLRWIKR